MNKNDYNLTKETSNETIHSWSHRNYISEELQAKLEKVGALVIPTEGYGDQSEVLHFPEGTEHLVSFLQGNNKFEDQQSDICIEEAEYKELALHADLIIIASTIATTVFAPILVSLISKYLKQRLGSRKEDITVKASLTVSDTNNGKSVSLTYEGPATTYEKVMLDAVKEVVGQKRIPDQEIKMISAPSENINDNDE